MAHIGVFGEVLFDHFPDGTRVLGGAPFNVAWHLQALGAEPQLISRVGSDPEGDAVRAAMAEWGMDTATLETDPEL
ncbi:MAG: PfkB family carbohydrate kinase, partial [Xanthomonadales bacterium]|nr:PfkB family carbohydrate kinase [Xanthomonadales bacterium]